MSVTGPSFNINAINKLAELELKHGTGENGSWHDQVSEVLYTHIMLFNRYMTHEEH